MKKLKKGFTIVELVIVIAVIAILASVLIPVFSNVVEKANLSADQQAVRQMNTLLATYDKDDVKTVADVKIKLSADNIDANNYKPLTKNTEFFWDKSENAIILVKNGAVIYPDNLKGQTDTDEDWASLSGNGNETAVSELKSDGTLDAGEVVNMQGASINLTPENGYVLGSSDASAPATIKNVVSDEGSKVLGNTGEYADNHYYAGLIKIVKQGTEVTVQNLVIDGAVIGDTTVAHGDTARVGIIAGQVDAGGTLNIKNVIIKNSTVFGGYRVGALVGAVYGTVNIENVTLENVTVKANTIGAAAIGQVSITKGAKVSFVNFDKGDVKVEALSNGTVEIRDGENYELVSDTYYPQVTTKNCWIETIAYSNAENLQAYWYAFKAADSIE